MGHLNNDTLVLNDTLCVLNLLLCGYAIWVAYTGLRPSEVPQPEKAEPSVPPAYERMLLSPRDARLHLTLRDYLVMGVTCVVYGVLAFANLGSTVAPQTGWGVLPRPTSRSSLTWREHTIQPPVLCGGQPQ